MVKMGLSTQNASDILGIPLGADLNCILMRYKQLSIKWHPEKHKHSPESQKKFKQVALAYKRLTVKDYQKDLNINECLSLFQQIVFNRPATSNGRKHSSSDSSDNSDDNEDSEDSEDDRLKGNGSVSKNNAKTEVHGANSTNDLTEEEKEKRRAEKRKLKKKRQKERKRLEKEQKTNSSNGKSKKGQKNSSSSNAQEINNVISRASSSDEENTFDPTSAFFTKVVSKKKKGCSDQTTSSKKGKATEKKSDDEAEEIINPKVLRSRQLAIRGNEMAQMDQYTAAIQLFTEAINLEPSDFRFFGNRSFCYDRIEQYDKALRDAEKAIKLDKEWPKGYFRKGRALAGLKMFAEAEKAFMQVLKLDKNCDDAVTELLRVRTHQLMDMGFSRSQSEEAIKTHGSVQAALDSLLASVGDNTVSDLYITDDEDEGFSVHRPAPIPPPTSHPTDVKMESHPCFQSEQIGVNFLAQEGKKPDAKEGLDPQSPSPTNPEGLTALWVGNVLPSVTEKRLNQLFSKFGQVTSVRPLPDKYCAFINFKTKEAAGRAMHQLQGTEIDGQKLLIKFPDNPLTSGTGNVTIRKAQNNNGAVKQGVRNTPKQSGPVNGDECYFWRTTGCTFGGECKWEHLPNSRGVDRKPWQK